MESVLARYRNLIILVGVLFLQVLGLAVQVKKGSNQLENTRLIRIWAGSAITPFERALVWIENSTGNLWHDYFYLRGVRVENRQLKEQIEQMRLEQVRLAEDAAQAHRLQALLGFKEQFGNKTVAAQVIGSSASDLSRIVYIDKGENDGLKPDMAVITADGIVGKVLLVSKNPSIAQVLLINDQWSGVGVILEKSRLQGVLRGTANGEVTLEHVMSDEQVAPGETVLTSGGDQIFPKGLPVGTVTKVGIGKEGFLSINVKPNADLGKVEEVLVLVEKRQPEAIAEEKMPARAADILAQRLPSVPDKPAQPASATAGAAAGTGKVPVGANAGPKTVGAPTAGAQAGKNASATGSTKVTPATGQLGSGAKPTAAQKSTAASGGVTTAKPPATPTKPMSAQPASPAPAKPSAKSAYVQPARSNPSTQPPAPPAKSQPPAGQDTPD
jgi:rod shape-determining protein MreC